MRFPQLGVALLVLMFAACNNSGPELDEEYTVSGHLYEGLGESPWANQSLYLEATKRTGFGGGIEFTNLGSTATDENGFFSITYDQKYTDGAVDFGPGTQVELRRSESSTGGIMFFPWNVSFQRDFAQQDHSRIIIPISFSEPVSDTLFISAWGIIKGDFSISTDIGGFSNVRLLAIPPSELQQSNLEVFVIASGGGDYLNTPRTWGIKYGIGREDITRSIYAGFEDSIPDDYNIVEGKIRGFPFTDTLHLNL